MSSDADDIRRSCRRFLREQVRHPMRDRLRALADLPQADGEADLYGSGGPVDEVQRRVAELLGKPTAQWVSKGVIAQQAALRAWTERTGRATVALHPLSHIDRDESSAYERLHGLQPIRLGEFRPFTVEDLDRTHPTPGVVTVELPLRHAGLELPTWHDLEAISRWCRERRVPLHVDGARLFETATHYGRELAEIAALADSVYVSFYKGLGGLGGCVLAGEADFLAACEPWLDRHGAQLFHSYPYALAALDGLNRRLPALAGFRQRAIDLAAALAAIDDVQITPDPPHVNGFHLYLPGPPEELHRRHLHLAAETGDWLFSMFGSTPVAGRSVVEIQVGDATAAFTDTEIVDLVRRLLTR